MPWRMATDPHHALMQALLDAVGGPEGTLPIEQRRALLQGQAAAGALQWLAAKVLENPRSITEETFDQLRERGVSEDALYEIVCAAAIGAGWIRMVAGLALVEKKDAR